MSILHIIRGGEALRVLGSHADVGCPGLEWPCGSCAGRQECVADVSYENDAYLILWIFTKVFCVVYVVVSDTMRFLVLPPNSHSKLA